MLLPVLLLPLQMERKSDPRHCSIDGVVLTRSIEMVHRRRVPTRLTEPRVKGGKYCTNLSTGGGKCGESTGLFDWFPHFEPFLLWKCTFRPTTRRGSIVWEDPRSADWLLRLLMVVCCLRKWHYHLEEKEARAVL